jgi:hypothetical protein
VLKRETNHTIWHRRGEQLLDSSPEIADVHCPVQLEQRFLQCRTDHRLALSPNHAVPPHFATGLARASRVVLNCARNKKLTTHGAEMFNNHRIKKETKDTSRLSTEPRE